MQEQVLPDARDGLTSKERIILYCLHQLQLELNKEYVPTIMLYGRISEFINISEHELQATLIRIKKAP